MKGGMFEDPANRLEVKRLDTLVHFRCTAPTHRPQMPPVLTINRIFAPAVRSVAQLVSKIGDLMTPIYDCFSCGGILVRTFTYTKQACLVAACALSAWVLTSLGRGTTLLRT